MIISFLKHGWIKVWTWFKKKMSKRKSKKIKAFFWSLTPKKNLKLKIYNKAINYAFSKKDIHNIAISGAYGAGKSSILASYKKKHPSRQFLHISLAHYQPLKKQDDNKGNIVENTLEVKILNQLIHQLPTSRIPQTGFRVKHPVRFGKTLFWAVVIASFCLTCVYVSTFTRWVIFAKSIAESVPSYLSLALEFSTLPTTRFYALIACALLGFFFLYKIIKLQRIKNFLKRLKIQGNEIDLTNGETDSFFDRYLNEVRYLFDNVGVDAIVFEDMDRFNMESIFERLHEINTLVNSRRKWRKPLRFFYLLRDDIYTTKDRTKFFDFIIPVVPVIDASNSYNKLVAMLKKVKMVDKFDDSFLQGISLYIDDMRLLQNIVNEFTVYYSELCATEPNANNMLAMITYKNLFPKDFCDLQLGRGYVATLFKSKDILKAERKEELNKGIEDSEEEIHRINDEIAVQENEIDRIYSSRSKTQAILNEIQTRKKYVADKKSGRLDELGQLISDSRKALLELNQAKLHELLTRENTNEFMLKGKHITSFSSVLENDYFALLKYLIRNGFIDEAYSDYMTYFYAGTISVTDKTFLRSLTDQEAKEYTHPLRNAETVLKRMRDKDFDQVESLNFDLLTKMLETENRNLQRYVAMMKTNDAINFITSYFEKTPILSKWIQCLNKYWVDFTQQAIINRWFDKESLTVYSLNLLLYLDSETLKSINIDNCLTSYISEIASYLHISNPDVDKLLEAFKTLGVRFEVIDEDQATPSLLTAVYQSRLYRLTENNIAVMLHTQYGINDDELIKHLNYTTIMSQPDSSLASYVLENIEEYMRLYLIMCDKFIDDSEDAVIAILNNTSITLDIKRKYIQFARTVVTDIKAITCFECWDDLLTKNLVAFSEHNVLAVFFYNEELTSLLVSLINKSPCTINRDTVQTEFENDKLVVFMEAILQNDKVSDTAFECWISALYELCREDYVSFDVGTALNERKMRFLFDHGIISMGEDELKFIRQYYPTLIRYYVTKHIAEYVDMMDTSLFDHDELLTILTWQDIPNEIKLKLLEYASQPIKILGQNYEEPIAAYIVTNNFDESELLQCMLTYNEYGSKLQKAIIEQVLSAFDVAVEHAHQLSNELLTKLLVDEKDVDKRVDLLIRLINRWNQEEILTELDKNGLTEYRKLLVPHASKTVSVNARSCKLLDAFKSAKWIDSYGKDNNDPSLYRIELIKKKAK